jgi:hypothetical protein
VCESPVKGSPEAVTVPDDSGLYQDAIPDISGFASVFRGWNDGNASKAAMPYESSFLIFFIGGKVPVSVPALIRILEFLPFG